MTLSADETSLVIENEIYFELEDIFSFTETFFESNKSQRRTPKTKVMQLKNETFRSVWLSNMSTLSTLPGRISNNPQNNEPLALYLHY